MIISENKPINEILGFLKNAEKVVLIGCNQCAAICKSGGEEEVLKMKEALEIEGKTVLGYRILDPACNLLKSKKDLKELKSELADADAVLSLACGDGTQTIVKNLKNIPVYPANNTMFIGETKRIGEFEEACKALHHEDGSKESFEVQHTYNEQQIAWFRAGSALNAR